MNTRAPVVNAQKAPISEYADTIFRAVSINAPFARAPPVKTLNIKTPAVNASFPKTPVAML